MTPSIRASRDLLTDTRGAVFLEFLMAVIPIWTFFVCILQLALIAQASLIVRHSADAAARSAAVVLPDDPAEYGGEPEMSVARNRVTVGNFSDLLAAASPRDDGSGTFDLQSSSSDRTIANLGRSRLNTIRLAAHVPLMPLAPATPLSHSRATLKGALPSRRSLASALVFQAFAVAVTFPEAEVGMVAGPEVTVRVSYAYQCQVPLARRILCQSFDAVEAPSEWKQSLLSGGSGLLGGRFRKLQHQASAMIHDAPYEYRPRRS